MSRGITGEPTAGVTAKGRDDDIEALVKRARGLDTAAWDRLYVIAFPQVYRYVSAKVRSSAEAEDITEEVFVGALQTVASLRASDEAGFLGWLFQIARFKLADHLRRQYRRPTEPLDPEVEFSDPAPSPEDEAIRRDDRSAVRAALAELTQEQQEVIVMKFSLGYDNARVATILGKTPGAINQLQHRALGAMRRFLERARV
jgi:RNA polymerase sigma-70 factor (ECF subfamily)